MKKTITTTITARTMPMKRAFAADGLHPSAEAYAAWARRLAEIAS